MSKIEDFLAEYNRVSQNIKDAYSMIKTKNGELPTAQNSNYLALAIATIFGDGVIPPDYIPLWAAEIIHNIRQGIAFSMGHETLLNIDITDSGHTGFVSTYLIDQIKTYLTEQNDILRQMNGGAEYNG